MAPLVDDLEAMVEPDARGDPESPLRWTLKRLRQITVALRERGHDVSRRIVSDILHDLNYSLQGNQKTLVVARGLMLLGDLLHGFAKDLRRVSLAVFGIVRAAVAAREK
jgi:hypothetical protein